MAKDDSRSLRVGIWWTIVVSCVLALLLTPELTERQVTIASTVLSLALCACGREHGWFKAPSTIGVLPRLFIVLAGIGMIVGAFAWYAWPPKSIVIVKPGVWLNPDSPKAVWTFLVVVRGPHPAYNVTLRMEDVQLREQIRREMNAAPNDTERQRLVSQLEPLIRHYGELDASTVDGKDRQDDTFSIPAGLQRREKYEVTISFRGVDEKETLEILTPEYRDDWQVKMKVLWKDHVIIDCQDPRFPQEQESKASDLPGCFPDFPAKGP